VQQADQKILQKVEDLEYIEYIPGIGGMIGQLKTSKFLSNSVKFGRKFEAERAITYYHTKKVMV
jgi:hypothetical protein